MNPSCQCRCYLIQAACVFLPTEPSLRWSECLQWAVVNLSFNLQKASLDVFDNRKGVCGVSKVMSFLIQKQIVQDYLAPPGTTEPQGSAMLKRECCLQRNNTSDHSSEKRH